MRNCSPATVSYRDGPGFAKRATDEVGAMSYMQERYFDPNARFISPDPVEVRWDNFNRYAYANNNLCTFVDPDGRESGAFYTNANYQMAQPSLEHVGLFIDITPGIGDVKGFVDAYNDPSAINFAAATVGLVPGLGDVAGKAIKAGSNIADTALVVRGGTAAGANSAQGIAAGTSTRADNGITGFSVESSNGASLCDLCANIPNNQVGVTTVGKIRAAGGEVTATPGRSPNHATVSGLPPQTASDLLTPAQPNPVPKPERTQWD